MIRLPLLHLQRKRPLPRGCLFMSTSSTSSRVSLEMESSTGIATITMQHPPVNSLSLEMNVDLTDAIRTASQDRTMEALILQSSNPKVFSAGLDLKELYSPSTDRLVAFWKSFQQVYLDLYGCRLATIAVIEGHAVAGGCMLALSADYRVMANQPKLTIGLNETQLGITAPTWLAQQLVDTVGRRTAELGLMRGTLWSPCDALAIQLVDQVVLPSPVSTTKEAEDGTMIDSGSGSTDTASTSSDNSVRHRARHVAKEFLRIPASARVASKKMVRQNRIDRLEQHRQEDINAFVHVVTAPATQERLGAYLASLSSASRKS